MGLGDWLVKNFREGYGLDPTVSSEEKAKFEKNRKYRKELENRINGNDQFLIGGYISDYLDYYEKEHKALHPPKYYTSITGENPQRTRSHLFGIKGMEHFVNLDSAKLSSLVPCVRLHQEYRKATGEFIKKEEMIFDDYQSELSITSDRRIRGSGAGIKEVSIDMEGDNIATADRMYRVRIKVYFDSIDKLFEDRGGYQYVDLFRLLARDPTKVQEENKEIKILRLEYGYHEPSYPTLRWTEAEKQAIREAKRVIALNLYKHTLDYNENGSLTLDLEYHGYAERKVTKIDVFTLGMDEKQRQDMRKAQTRMKELKKQKPSVPKGTPPEEDKELEKQIKAEANKLADMRKKAYSSFLAQIMVHKKMYNVGYAAQSTRLKVMELSNKDGSKASSLKELSSGEVGTFLDGSTEKKPRKVIQFFYLGDLLDRIIMLAKEEPEFNTNFEFSFGSFFFRGVRGGTSREIPISAIPISNTQFGEWFRKNVQEKNERENYDLASFFKDIVSLALTSFSSESRVLAPPSSPVIRAQTFNTSGPIPKGVIHNPYAGGIPSSTLKNGVYQKNLVEHFFIYGANDFAEPPRNGDSQEDSNDGIYWLVAANENGVTKNIKYSKADTKFLTEARITSGGFSEKKRILWSLYKANVDMVGNPIFKPGMMVYVTSNAFTSDAEDIGLSGYFQVLKVRNSIQDGKFKTELETIWQKPTKSKK